MHACTLFFLLSVASGVSSPRERIEMKQSCSDRGQQKAEGFLKVGMGQARQP